MSRVPNITAHYSRLLARWPLDKLRPDNLHFQRLLQSRLQSAGHEADSGNPHLVDEANAAYLLLDNTFTKRYALSNKTMKPASRPTLYEELDRELEEGPQRGLLAYMWKRVSGMIRRQ